MNSFGKLEGVVRIRENPAVHRTAECSWQNMQGVVRVLARTSTYAGSWKRLRRFAVELQGAESAVLYELLFSKPLHPASAGLVIAE